MSADIVVFELDAERQLASDPDLIARSGRSARTLHKDGPLRVTLVALGPGGELAEHSAAGPITVQVIHGHMRFTAGAEVYDLGPGQVLAAKPGIRHAVTSEQGAAFLLTVVASG